MSNTTCDINVAVDDEYIEPVGIMNDTTNGTEPLDEYDQEIARYEELLYTLGKEFVSKPNKEFIGLDFWKFLKDFPQVKADIDHYIRYRLELLRSDLHNQLVNKVNVKRIFELEKRLRENSKYTMTAISTEK